jgi:hypothetical protein
MEMIRPNFVHSKAKVTYNPALDNLPTSEHALKKVEEARAAIAKWGLPEGFDNAEDIAVSKNLIHFKDKPIRFFENGDVCYYSMLDVIRATSDQMSVSKKSAFEKMQDFLEDNPILEPHKKQFDWRVKPENLAFWRLTCLDTEGVLLLLNLLETSEAVTMAAWWQTR